MRGEVTVVIGRLVGGGGGGDTTISSMGCPLLLVCGTGCA